MRTTLLTLCLTLIFGWTYASDYRFGRVSDEELLLKEHPTDPSADAAILYREIKTEFQYSESKGWYITTDYFERIKIFTKEGAEYANKTVALYNGQVNDELKNLRAFTFNMVNGKVDRQRLGSDGIFKNDVTKYMSQTKITMPDVQEGSVIDIRYSVESSFFMNIDEFQFQERIPVDKLYMSFSAPERFRYQTYHRGWLSIPVNQTMRDKNYTLLNQATQGSMLGSRKGASYSNVKLKENVYVVEMEDIPAIQEEPYVGNIENYMAGIQFELGSADAGIGMRNFSVTWDDVAETIYKSDAFGAELQRTGYFEKDIDQLLEGITDPMEKAQRVYWYVLQKMNWNNIGGVFTRDGVRKAYRDNSGNAAEINLMLTAMLRHARIKAYPVLVSTKANGIPLFPTINGFNYVLIVAELPQGVFLMDATNSNAGMGILGFQVMNGNGRVIISETESTWIPLNSASSAVSQTLMNASINSDMEVSGKAQQRFSGNYALNYRDNFRNLADSEWVKRIEKLYPGVDFSNISFENLDNPMESVTMNFDFDTFDGIEEVDGTLYLSPLFFMQTKKNPFKSETRNYPVDFGYSHRSQIIMNFALPEGYEVASLPENAMAVLADNVGRYRYLISQQGNILQISVDLTMMQPVIDESEYESLKGFYEGLVNKESEKIVLKKI